MRPARDHFGRRRPARPLGLAGDLRRAGPAERLGARRHAVADGALARQHEVEEVFLRIDDDRAGRLAGGIVDLVALVTEVEFGVGDAGHELGVAGRQRRIGHALVIAARKNESQRQNRHRPENHYRPVRLIPATIVNRTRILAKNVKAWLTMPEHCGLNATAAPVCGASRRLRKHFALCCLWIVQAGRTSRAGRGREHPFHHPPDRARPRHGPGASRAARPPAGDRPRPRAGDLPPAGARARPARRAGADRPLPSGGVFPQPGGGGARPAGSFTSTATPRWRRAHGKPPCTRSAAPALPSTR